MYDCRRSPRLNLLLRGVHAASVTLLKVCRIPRMRKLLTLRKE